MSNVISFNNGLATLKDGQTLDEDALRQTRVYGKLMLNKGMKFASVKSVADFMSSENGSYIRAELFVVNRHGSMVTDSRVWLNVSKDATIMRDDQSRMYWVELIHPVVDLSKSTVAFGGAE